MAAECEPNARTGSASRLTPSFVEVPPATDPAPALTEIDLYRKDGARLRLHAPDTALTAIVKSFLEA